MLVGQVPNRVFQRKLFFRHDPDLGKNTDREATHRKKELGIVLGIYSNETVFPLNRRQGPRQTLLDVPEHSATKINIVLDQPHTTVARPAAFIVIPNVVVVRRIWLGGKVTLNQITSFVDGESEENVEAIHITGIQANGMASFSGRVAVLEEVIGHLWRTIHLASALQTEDKEIKDKACVVIV